MGILATLLEHAGVKPPKLPSNRPNRFHANGQEPHRQMARKATAARAVHRVNPPHHGLRICTDRKGRGGFAP